MKKLLKRYHDVKLMFTSYSPQRIRESGHDPVECLETLYTLGFKVWKVSKEREALESVKRVKELVKDDATKTLFCRR